MRRAGIWIGLVLGCGIAALTGAAESEILAIRAGQIWTIRNGTIKDGTILIERGRITALGPEVVIPAQARLIAADNRIVTPGLIDVCSRFLVRDSELDPRHAGSADQNILDALDPFAQGIEELWASGLTTVYLAPAGHSLMGGQTALLKLKPLPAGKGHVLKAEVAVKTSLGYAPGNVISSAERLEQFAKLRETFFAVQAYVEEWAQYQRRLKAYEQQKPPAKEGEKKDATQASAKEEAAKTPPPKSKRERPTKPARSPAYEVLAQVLQRKLPLQVEAHDVVDIRNALRLAQEFRFDLILERGQGFGI